MMHLICTSFVCWTVTRTHNADTYAVDRYDYRHTYAYLDTDRHETGHAAADLPYPHQLTYALLLH